MLNEMKWRGYSIDAMRLRELLPHSLRLRAMVALLEQNLNRPGLPEQMSSLTRLMAEAEQCLQNERGRRENSTLFY